MEFIQLGARLGSIMGLASLMLFGVIEAGHAQKCWSEAGIPDHLGACSSAK